jgi:hypothetical protein
MLWTIFVILLVLWILGFSFHVAGGLIHLLLVVALIVLVINLVSRRRAAYKAVSASTVPIDFGAREDLKSGNSALPRK